MKQNVYSVSQVNSYIKNMFTQDFLCSSILIKGELSNVKYHGSGHIYFTLKDAGAAISCVMFASSRAGLSFKMEEGQLVIAAGSIDVFERDGRYQLYAKQIELAGGGQLYEKFEALKRELEESGMFDPLYKQPIPRYTKRLGVVTAQTGAAVRDIINVAKRRNPYIEIILYPAIVQGEYAVQSIINGIHALEMMNVDVMIVGRGGGSIEDLWAFNSKEVAQAVFDCNVPVISAVGHETDTTIIDYVSDLRAPTPSAAAELAVCDLSVLLQQLFSLYQKLTDAMLLHVKNDRMLMENIALKLKMVSPQVIMQEKRMRLLSLEERLNGDMENKLSVKRHELEVYITRLQGLSPLDKLKQGYSYIETIRGKTLTSIEQIKENDFLTVFLQDGTVEAKVEQVNRRQL